MRGPVWVGALVVVALAAGAFKALQPGSTSATSPPSVSTSAPQPTAPTPHLSAQASPAPQRAPSVAEQYRRLAASGQPKDAFKAYAMLAACLGAQSQWQEARMQRAGDSEPGLAYRLKSGELERLATEACGDLSPRDMESRLALLKTAAEAGVPGAALDMAYLGPYGDASEIGDRWSDPVVNEWRNNVIDWLHLAAAHGDVGAMYSLSRQYETGLGLIGAADPEKALTYEWAVRVMRAAATNKPIKQPDPQLAALSARLSPDQAEAARIAGQNIAEAAMKGGK